MYTLDNSAVAYVDECGNFGTHFESSGNSTHYILAAIVMPKKIIESEHNILLLTTIESNHKINSRRRQTWQCSK